MKLANIFLTFGLLAAGCAAPARIDASVYPANAFNSTDVDESALYQASQLVGLDAPRPTTPQNWALGLADVEYIAGAFNTHARWIGIDAAAQEQLLIARREDRRAVGISEQAPSQAVLNALLAVSHAPDSGLQAALADPVFTLGPAATLDRLNHMPKLFTTPYAIARTNKAKYGMNSGCNLISC